jgi:hypothetical protein
MNLDINFKIVIGVNKQFSKKINKRFNNQINKHFMEGNDDRFNEIWFFREI